jgi:hypothetical protein
MSTSALRSAYKSRKAGLIKTFGGNGNVPQQYRVQMQELMREIKEREARELEQSERNELYERSDAGSVRGSSERGGSARKKETMEMPKFLGNSVLGGKKVGLGMAPVAPMVHLKKNRDGAGGKRGE